MKRFVRLVLPIFPFERRSTRRPACRSSSSGTRCVDLHPAAGTARALLRVARPRPRRADGGAAAGQPPQRAARDPAGPRRRGARCCIAARVPAVQFVVARAPNLDDELFAPLVGAGRAASRSSRAAPTTCSHACGRRRDRVRHRDGADRAARAADGHRLSRVAADLPARPALRAGRHLRHGQPRRGPHGRARADSGRLHAGARRATRPRALLTDPQAAASTRAGVAEVRAAPRRSPARAAARPRPCCASPARRAAGAPPA